ncbi:unnamed protein product [Pleuronectes platessa]|uniref:Uncharacterized protein n=1 Tax=Pleuronectes platessa TaxID=8262 RepID=A0A9N7UIF7_PLEPL|nr:unnamed protein product [Pleuronectes platessa]
MDIPPCSLASGRLTRETPALPSMGPSLVWGKKEQPEAGEPQDARCMNACGGGAAGEEMAERSSSCRKRGRGVKWRQVFHDKPFNPPPPPTPSSSSLHRTLWRLQTSPTTDTCSFSTVCASFPRDHLALWCEAYKTPAALK